MTKELENKCYICSREIDDGEKCLGLLDGKVELDQDDVIFYDNDDQHDAVLVCNDCSPEHIRLMLHGRELVGALKEIEVCHNDKVRVIAHEAITKIEGSK
jgi:cell fate regulator YaaT (PSP1 superfamily)